MNYNQPHMTSSYPYQNNMDIYQNRLNDMAQQFAGQQQSPQQNGYMPPFQGFNMQPNTISAVGAGMANSSYNVRAVAGYTEVAASPTPMDGSVSVFIDVPNGKIYTKQLNMNDGNPLFRTYALTDNLTEIAMPVEKPLNNAEKYVEKSEFDSLKARFDELWSALNDVPQTKQTKSKEAK